MIDKTMLQKDNEITEILSILSEHPNFTIILKGGTSLTKGYQIAERMSEDIDLLFFAEEEVTKNKIRKYTKDIREDLQKKYTLENEKPLGANVANHFSCSIKNDKEVTIKLDLRYSDKKISFEEKPLYNFTEEGTQIKTSTKFNVADLKRTFFDKIFAFQNKAYTILVKSSRYNKITKEEKEKQDTLSKPEIKRLARHAYDITKIEPLIEFSKDDIEKYMAEEKNNTFVTEEGKVWLQNSYKNRPIYNFLIFSKINEFSSWFNDIKNDFINDINVEEIKKEIKRIQKKLKDTISP